MNRIGFAVLGAAGVLIGAASAQPAASQNARAPVPRASAAPPKFTAQQLTALPTANWITNGGNLYNQRYSPLARINKDNVATLRPAWRTHLNGSGTESKYSGQAQPIVYDGVIYVPTGANDVFALDADDGKILWTYEAHLDANITVICCGWLSRGVAIGDGKVFSGQLDGKLVALDHATGKVVWSIQAETNQDGFSITGAPLYYDGLVITGFAGGDRAARGRVKAYDAKDGKLVWTFYTIPGPGEVGHDTWPANNDTWKYGGAAVWQTPAVDPELGLVYFSTGNPGPDLIGSVRPGDNLFSVSMVAIEAKTGKYRWHFQQVHHDLWDYDSPNPVVLFDATVDGRLRKGIVEIGKTGYVYILDRETGKPLVGIDEVAVPQEPRQATAATQPIPRGDEVIPHAIDIEPEGFKLTNNGRIFTPFWDKPVVVKPLATGGVNWPPSSYDPTTNLFYVCATDGAAAYSTKEGGVEWAIPTPGGRYFGGDYTRSQVPRRGVIAAVDVRTNKLAWQQQWGEMCYAGSTVTGGGLLFLGRNDGRLTAHDKSNGALLWEYQTDAGIHAAVSTFERNGQQYIVALSAGSFFPGTTRGDSVYLFALDGAGVEGGARAEPSGGAELRH
ncbi:MAG TPA: PQQ-binding-like beta-propeller repeat protein [Gammaproteobacteria bacterium]|nr:PQQ-binding-like beta-propeller repeat protein [Gammaproteobacteria bacterium]